MKSTLERVAGRLVLVAASGLPLLTTNVVSAQDAPTPPAATQPAKTEVQRQLDALYRKNGMQAPSLSAEARQREVEARTRLREQREALARRQDAEQQPSAAPATVSAAPSPVSPAVVQPVPEIEFQPQVDSSATRTYRRSTTLKPSARHSHRYRPDQTEMPAPPVARQHAPAVQVGPTATAQPVAAQPQPRAPRRGFVLFGGGDNNRGSFLGRLFGRDRRQPQEQLVPPNPHIGIEPKPEFRAESIADGNAQPGSGPVVAPRVTPDSAGPAPSRVAKAPVASPAPAPGAEEESTFAAQPVESAKPTLAPKPNAPGFELPLAKSANANADVRPIPDDIGTPFPDGSERSADGETPVAETDVPAATKSPVIEPQKVAASPQLSSPPETDVDPRMKRIAERTDETGLKGFCPVALRDDRRLVDADETWAIVHKGRTYHLGSEEAQHKFESDPEKYAPVASGHDVILLTVEGRRVEGSLEHAVWYKDRLHLFSSRETLGRFVKSLRAGPFTESRTQQASGTIALPEPGTKSPTELPAQPDWKPTETKPEPKQSPPTPTAKPISTAEPKSETTITPATITPATDEAPESAVRSTVDAGDEADSFDGEATPFEEDFANPFEDEEN